MDFWSRWCYNGKAQRLFFDISSGFVRFAKEGRPVHELSITQNILDIALQAAAQQKASRIREIRLRMGPFSGVVPECVQMYLDVLAKGTPAEGAKIKVTTVPLKVLCRDCGREGEIDRAHIACPFCGSLRLKRLSGREFLVESLEVD